MHVTLDEPAEIVLRNTSEDERRRALAWIEWLERWETDPLIKQRAKKLNMDGNVYMLITPTDLRIFFSVEEDGIKVLDVAKKDTIMKFGRNGGATSS
jgi:hypothetical protein